MTNNASPLPAGTLAFCEAPDDALFPQAVIAEYLHVSCKCLEYWRCVGKGPKYCKVGKLVRYRKSDVQRFLDGIQDPPWEHGYPDFPAAALSRNPRTGRPRSPIPPDPGPAATAVSIVGGRPKTASTRRKQ